MNKQELIEHIGNTLDEYLKNTVFVKPVLSITEIANSGKVSLEFEINKNCILLDDISYQFGYDQGKLDGEWVGRQLKPEAGHADEAPRYVKNILARLRELPLHDREAWLKAIMGEFEQDFSRAKWREGYEQGKLEGSMVPYEEPQKVTIPQFVAGWIEYCKADGIALGYALYCSGQASDKKVYDWIVESLENQEIFARAWLDGYEVEKEKRYTVKLKNTNDYLNETEVGFHFYDNCRDNGKFTQKEIEEAGFGEVFNSPLFEVEEVQDDSKI